MQQVLRDVETDRDSWLEPGLQGRGSAQLHIIMIGPTCPTRSQSPLSFFQAGNLY